MIRKTMTITSIAILVAAISIATTMTMVQANPTGDLITISVSGGTPASVVDVEVVAAEEYDSDMIVTDAELLFTDSDADMEVDILTEVTINNPGSGVHSGTFFFAGGTDGEIDWSDTNLDNIVDIGELSLGVNVGAGVADLTTATLVASVHPITVDIDDGTVEILLPSGPPTTSEILVTIDDIQWVGETGAIGSFVCAGNVGAASTPLFDKDTLTILLTGLTVDTPIDIDCVFEAFHGSINKAIVGDCILEVKKSTFQVCTFKITYNGDRATIVDTISAGWEKTPVIFNDIEGFGDACSVDGQKNKKNNNKSATGFTCDDVDTSAEIDVTIETRESPGKGHGKKMQVVYKPTSCEDPFDINSGAKAILLDMDGNVVLGTLDGKPIVLDTSDSLSVFAVNNDSDGILCDDA